MRPTQTRCRRIAAGGGEALFSQDLAGRTSGSDTIVLSFDEARQLADDVYGRGWTLLTDLRSVLHELREKPIFTFCLSTLPSKFASLNPHDIKDLIIEISFDDLAYVTDEGVTTLDDVTHWPAPVHLSISLTESHLPLGAASQPIMTLGRPFCCMVAMTSSGSLKRGSFLALSTHPRS